MGRRDDIASAFGTGPGRDGAAAATRSHLPWGPFSLAFFGLAFARAWVSFVFVVPEASAPFPALSHGLFDAGYIVCSVGAVAFARRIVPYARRRWAIPATLGGMLLASLAFIAGPAGPRLPSRRRSSSWPPCWAALPS